MLYEAQPYSIQTKSLLQEFVKYSSLNLNLTERIEIGFLKAPLKIRSLKKTSRQTFDAIKISKPIER